MAAWDADAETTLPDDYRLARNSYVTMFWRSSLLGEAVEGLRSHGYDIVDLDAGSWASVVDLFEDVANALDFPDYFGRNLNALNDCKAAGQKAGGDAENSLWKLPPLRRNRIWSYDFVTRRTSDGKPVRVLNVMDEFTRVALGSPARSARSTSNATCTSCLSGTGSRR